MLNKERPKSSHQVEVIVLLTHSNIKRCQGIQERDATTACPACDGFFHNELATKFLSDPRVVTENAIKLTPDEMHAIYMDIFKPLDSFEMFYERLKAQEKEKEKEELDEERIR